MEISNDLVHAAVQRQVGDNVGSLMIREMGLEHSMRQCLEAALPLIKAEMATEIVQRLPEELTVYAEDPFGWLSDGIEHTTADSLGETVSYKGEGSIDLNAIAQIASTIVLRTPGE